MIAHIAGCLSLDGAYDLPKKVLTDASEIAARSQWPLDYAAAPCWLGVTAIKRPKIENKNPLVVIAVTP